VFNKIGLAPIEKGSSGPKLHRGSVPFAAVQSIAVIDGFPAIWAMARWR
jgi:hypothetical protein